MHNRYQRAASNRKVSGNIYVHKNAGEQRECDLPRDN
jgi:hypothetical protein